MATPEETLQRFHVPVRWAVNRVYADFPNAEWMPTLDIGQEALILLMSYAGHIERHRNGHGKLAEMEKLVSHDEERTIKLLSRQLRIDLSQIAGRAYDKELETVSADQILYWEERKNDLLDIA